MKQQKERILSENEIQSHYDGLQVQMKSMMECLKHNKQLMKEFGNATCEYGDKLEEISKKTIADMMKINTNKILRDMSAQIKQLGTQIMGTQAALKELINPINELSKQLKESYNDSVKQINLRRKEQEDQARKLNEVKSKVSTYQKSVLPIDSHMTPQYRNLRQQENMLTEEQRLKLDLSNLVIEESEVIAEKIHKTQSKCYEFVYMCLEQFNHKFNQIAQVKELTDGSLKNVFKSSNRSTTPQKVANNSRQLYRTPRGKCEMNSISPNQKRNLASIQEFTNRADGVSNFVHTPSRDQISQRDYSQNRGQCYVEYDQRRDRTPQREQRKRDQTPNRVENQMKSNEPYELIESEVFEDSRMMNRNCKQSRQESNYSNKENQNSYLNDATIFSKKDRSYGNSRDITMCQTNLSKIKRSDVSSGKGSNQSFYNCKQLQSNFASINPQEYI